MEKSYKQLKQKNLISLFKLDKKFWNLALIECKISLIVKKQINKKISEAIKTLHKIKNKSTQIYLFAIIPLTYHLIYVKMATKIFD